MDMYCSRCAQRYALWDAAYSQLEERVREVTAEWLTIWGNVSAMPDLDEILMQIGIQIDAERKAGTFAAPEGVQPFPHAA